MTGTSLDAIDIAVLQIEQTSGSPHGGHIRLEGFFSRPFEPALRQDLLNLQARGHDELHRAAVIANRFAEAISGVVLKALKELGLHSSDIAAIGVHGQTIRHQPELGYSLQLNAPARIAEATGISVVSDFRSRDVAAGGQGAPLVPAFHEAIFSHADECRAIVNVGGIANITWLGNPLLGYDTGPGNMLMDAWIQRHAGKAFDQDGAWAATGSIHSPLLEAMLKDDFFRRTPPKSTGRDLFSLSWLDALIHQQGMGNITPQDVQATLLALTAQSIAAEILLLEQRALDSCQRQCERVLICGGGANNAALMERLTQAIISLAGRPMPVVSTATLGWPPQTIEAAAFAWLADRTIAGLPGNAASVTGARGPRILGSITPA
ncbi:MAG: anhydro-N-acetylmuramic acid kinase [Burkholderiaceae bacterium]|nr:anhydro-N-acetylmuramic acid kinase [Burkholderiaceae bacterium]